MINRATILCVVPRIPQRDIAAGDRRFVVMMQLLARQHNVHLFAIEEPTAEFDRYIQELQDSGVRVLSWQTWGWLNGAVQRQRYDLGLFEFYQPMEQYGDLFRQYQPWAKRVVDSVDMHFYREQAAAALGLMDAAIAESNRTKEIAVYEAADRVIVVTEEDQKLLESHSTTKSVSIIPIIIPIRTRPSLERLPELLFVGGFKHLPNADGLLWFVSEIWPIVLRSVPNARLTVVGSFPPKEVTFLDGKDGISVIGYVADTVPFLDRAAVSIAPLRFGAGMKGKVAEAMASGIPVATTTVGAQGFAIEHGEHAIIADEPNSLASGIIQLLRDTSFAERIGSAGRDLVAKLCSPEVVQDKLHRMVNELLPAIPQHPPLKWRLRRVYVRLRTSIHNFIKRFHIIFT